MTPSNRGMVNVTTIVCKHPDGSTGDPNAVVDGSSEVLVPERNMQYLCVVFLGKQGSMRIGELREEVLNQTRKKNTGVNRGEMR